MGSRRYRQFHYDRRLVSRIAALTLQALERHTALPEVSANYGMARIINSLIDNGWLEHDRRTVTEEGRKCWRHILSMFDKYANGMAEQPPVENVTTRDNDILLNNMRRHSYHWRPPSLRQIYPEVQCE